MNKNLIGALGFFNITIFTLIYAVIMSMRPTITIMIVLIIAAILVYADGILLIQAKYSINDFNRRND